MVFIGRNSAGGSCEISVRDLFCFLSASLDLFNLVFDIRG